MTHLEALKLAEAALADIGDADREPGDDLAWCERRAAQDLPAIRAALAAPVGEDKPVATVLPGNGFLAEVPNGLPPGTPLYDRPLPAPAEPACHHRIADARNEHVQSGYVCLDCGAVFAAADHGAPAQAEPSDMVLVPRKATDAMRYAWMEVYDEKGWTAFQSMWDACIEAAAPTPQVQAVRDAQGEAGGHMIGWRDGTYVDSTPHLHVGDSSFEDWYQAHPKACSGDKQLARDAYAAGMGDPLVTYATPSAPTSAGDGERADARIVEIPTAFDWSSRHAMAVTREWCRGWDDARAEMKGKS